MNDDTRNDGSATHDSDRVRELVRTQQRMQAAQRARDEKHQAEKKQEQQQEEKQKEEKQDQKKDGKQGQKQSSGSDDDSGKHKSGVQAGLREQPQNPLPPEQLDKPGHEADMSLKPRYRAPDYRGSGKLDGMVALVTGADSGIGRAVAVLFAREGADVAIAYLNEHDDARQTARDVEAEGRRALLLPGDVRSTEWCGEAVDRTIAQFGRLDVLVNNAAFQLHANDLTELDDERILLTLETNVKGTMAMSRAALPHLKRGASIINTGSVVGLRGSKELFDYGASKGAIHAFTKSLASSVIGRGIRVNCVAPGPVWTPLNPADRPADEVSAFGSDSDMKRVAQPEEIAPAFVFLASPACASYITGIVLPITGSVGAI